MMKIVGLTPLLPDMFRLSVPKPRLRDGRQHARQQIVTAFFYFQTNHSAPTTHFPSDKLSPVVPPFQTTTGVDKQSMTTQKKLSGSKTSMANSLNSSGEVCNC